METLLTTTGFLALTALSVWLHLRRTGSERPEACEATHPCPRCRSPVVAGSARCPACGVPQQVYELVSTPAVEGEAQLGSARAHALVRADLCVGCGTCVAACPEAGAITLEHKRATVHRQLCVGHGECVGACPVGAILLATGEAVHRVEVPEIGADFQSNVPGIYIVGELGGRGLIKNAVNEGRVAVEQIAVELPPGGPRTDGDAEAYDVVIVGSGPAGLSAGLAAHGCGLRYLVLEQGTLSDTVRKYPRRKLLFAEPVRIPVYGDLWVADASKEALLQIWEGIVARTGLAVRTGARVIGVARRGPVLEVETSDARITARRVVLALGRRGTPRRLGVPGEELEKVLYDIAEMEAFAGRRVLVVGGGDSAVESALGLANQPGTTVTLSYRGETFGRVKDRNREKLDAAVARERVQLMLSSEVRAIENDRVLLDVQGSPHLLPNDDVIVRIGGDAPYAFLQRLGIRIVQKDVPLAVALLLLSGAAPLAAQVSPGPLARAHAQLEGVTNCTQCHGRSGTEMPAKCLSCHREIAWLVREDRGLHAADPAVPCASCHPDHAGRDFQLIEWPGGARERFDHRRSGWALEQRHAELQCDDCHTADLRTGPAATLAPRPQSASWTGLQRECVACHADPHDGQLAQRCESCHDADVWEEPPGFDHSRTDYPLTGRHERVACAECHVDGYRPLEYRSCADCHADPHRSRLGTDCASCHRTSGFSVVGTQAFDHDRTRYPLRGRHAAVRCAECHDPASPAQYTPAFATCAGCHADAHAGTATRAGGQADCADCHTVSGFRPSVFTAARHSATRYPLDGKHRDVACVSCHAVVGGEAARSLGTARVQLRPAFAACSDCHRNPHEGRFTPAGGHGVDRGCDACHGTAGFTPTTFDPVTHSDFGFALTEAHGAVPCAACHADAAAATTTCAACHDSPHGDQFAARERTASCDACHGTAAFAPAEHFDHGRDSDFPLGRAHAAVACERCHRPDSPGGAVRYRPLDARCENCHGGAP
jgi:thioredoxin reductase/ferredoxin